MSRIEKIREMINSGGKDDFLQHALALEYIKIGEEQPALEQFTELLERNPAYVGSYYHLAKLYERIGDNQMALNTYDKGIAEALKIGRAHV